jgi:hypothetical protein
MILLPGFGLSFLRPLQTAQLPGSAGLPVVVFTLSDAFTARHPQVTLSDLSDRIFVKEFSIPRQFY